MLACRSDCRWYLCGLFSVLAMGCASVTPPEAASPLPTSATAGDTTIVAIAPASSPSCNLWSFSGVEQAVGAVAATKHRIRDHVLAKLGMRFPGLEPTPELLLITDPANLGEDAPPSVKAAAEVKMKEDQAAQKIKGIRYLATIGCGGCYPQVEDALLKALEDCTEEVRYEAVLAIRRATGKECSFCSATACCSEKVQTKLLKMITMDPDCYYEPSARVRRQARLALQQCGPVVRVPTEENGEAATGDGGENGGTGGQEVIPETPPESLPDEQAPVLPIPESNDLTSLSFSSVDRALQPW